MKPYPTYKDSGIEWIGEIPEHWVLKRIKHTTYVKGRIGWKGLKSDEFLEESDSYIITGTDFINGKINWETCYQVPLERYDEDPFIQLKEKDLLITKDGTIGKIAVVENMPKIATLNSGVFVTRPKTDDYKPEYLYWILESDVFKSFYDFNKSGSTIQHLYQNVFNEFNFTIPSIEEQIQITNYLDKKTAQIDSLIAKKENLIQLLEEEKTALINQAVTKGLDPNVKMKDSGIEWLGEIPEHWEVIRLKYILNVQSGKGIKNEELIEKGNYKVYGGNGEMGRTNKFSSDQTDLIIGRVGALCGNIHLIYGEKWISDNALFARTNQDYEFIKFYLIFLDLNRFANKNAQPLITGTMVKEQSIGLPSLEEQKKIVSKIIQEQDRVDKLLIKIYKEIKLLKEYKATLISEIVTGKVDVRNIVIE